MFDLQRVYRFLAGFTFERKLSAAGQVSLGRQMYLLGQALARQHPGTQVWARVDAEQQEWIFWIHEKTGGEAKVTEIARRKVKGLDAQTLTGLDPQQLHPAQPVQLRLPWEVG